MESWTVSLYVIISKTYTAILMTSRFARWKLGDSFPNLGPPCFRKRSTKADNYTESLNHFTEKTRYLEHALYYLMIYVMIKKVYLRVNSAREIHKKNMIDHCLEYDHIKSLHVMGYS